jgi:hypothetical protein
LIADLSKSKFFGVELADDEVEAAVLLENHGRRLI